MIKILVVSDTHNDNFWFKYFDFAQFDYVLHAGDHQLSQEQIYEVTPYYVDGNNDWGSQMFINVEIDKFNFGITHGHEIMTWFFGGEKLYEKLYEFAKKNSCNVLIFGHTHIPYAKYYNDVLLLNPGSMHHSRHNGKRCYSIIEIDDEHNLTLENYELGKD